MACEIEEIDLDRLVLSKPPIHIGQRTHQPIEIIDLNITDYNPYMSVYYQANKHKWRRYYLNKKQKKRKLNMMEHLEKNETPCILNFMN
tara:strand:+ start:7645 stop:7911 length:267 start_codon:yes stop_codon:yes gene_type:complete